MCDKNLKRTYLEDIIAISKMMNVPPEDLLDNPEDYERLVEEVEYENSSDCDMIIIPTFEVYDENENN